MTKIIESKYKISRRLKTSVWGSSKDPFGKRNYGPGQHGPAGLKKISDYGRQLNAKQLLKGYYGRITEKQFKKIFQEALRLKGDTSENLVALLERRLASVVYRLNFSRTVFGARQLVSHKHVIVHRVKKDKEGNKYISSEIVNAPGYLLKEGESIELVEKAKNFTAVMESLEVMERDVPSYLELDTNEKSGKFVRLPQISDVPYPFKAEVNLVVEFYSRV